MKRETQIVIWQFILAFKQETGEQVNYLDLVKGTDYRAGLLATARDSGNGALAELADKVEQGLEDDQDEEVDFEDESESVLLAEAPDEAWHEPPQGLQGEPEAAPIPPTDMALEKPAPPTDRYAYRLRGALKRSEFSLLHRRALDRFAHKNGLPADQVLEIENRTRESLKLPPLDWARELTSVIADLHQHHDSLTTLKMQLQHTYVRAERLDEETFQRVYNAPDQPEPEKQAAPAPAAPAQPEAGKSNKAWIVVAALIAIGAIVATQL